MAAPSRDILRDRLVSIFHFPFFIFHFSFFIFHFSFFIFYFLFFFNFH